MHVVLDFETYYSSEYNIKTLGVLGYVRDPRFKAHGVGIKIDHGKTEWWAGCAVNRLLDLPWHQITLTGHNLYFDGTILFERFGITPKRRFDTMSAFRALFPNDMSANLDNVGKVLGLGEKLKGVLDNTKNKPVLTKEELAALGEYCKQDVDLTYEIGQALLLHVPEKERDLIDLTLRMSTDPVLEIDVALSEKALEDARETRKRLIKESGLPLIKLSSDEQFADTLRKAGIEVPTKISERTGKPIPALGKNDPEFLELKAARPEMDHIWAGRTEAKSNLNITRAAKWVSIGTTGSKKMPMPLNYFGAHTGRWTGMDNINVQNLPRKGALRKAILAPKDHVILVSDSAQIELRVNAWFAGQNDIVEMLRQGGDVYIDTAAEIYGKNREDITPNERQFGKVVTLGCGFGMGARKFKTYCAGGPLGMEPMNLSDDEAARTIAAYRKKNAKIVEHWTVLDNLIPIIAWEQADQMHQMLHIREWQVVLPNGLALQYPDLRTIEEQGGKPRWVFGDGRPLWGGTLDENIVQALARIIIGEQMLKVDDLDGVRVVGSTHDEIICVCHESIAEKRFEEIIEIMSIPPDWAPDLPLSAEGGWAHNYSK